MTLANVRPAQADVAPSRAAWAPLFVAALFVATLLATRAAVDARPLLTFEDDAFYYYTVARNIAAHGLSSFDGTSLTNGYHPLWQMIVAALLYLFRLSPQGVIVFELGLVFLGVFIFARALGRLTPIALTLIAVFVPYKLQTILGHGMETGVLFLAFAAFFVALQRYVAADGRMSIHWVSAAVVLCLLSRLESIVFVLPASFLLARSKRDRILHLAGVGAAILAYASINFALFGAPMPISGAVKSLGGLQFNQRIVRQLFGNDGQTLHNFRRSSLAFELLFLTVSLTTLLFVRPRSRMLVILHLSLIVGLVVFWTKLFLLSSWSIWEWYNFPLIPEFMLLTMTLNAASLGLLARSGAPARWDMAMRTVAGVAIALLGVKMVNSHATRPPVTHFDFEPLNALAARELGPTLRGARVAMGDRAGSFAYYYDGPVAQTEGLVNDLGYYKLLAGGGDVNAWLCKADVAYILSYQKDLGDYREHAFPVIREWLSQFKAPLIRVSRDDQVAMIYRPELYDNLAGGDEGDSYLYVWRTPGCAAK